LADHGQGQAFQDGQYVVFELGDETYGVDIADVREIITMQKVTRVPRAPEFVEGVINLRGKIIPVIDLRLRFGLPAAEATRSTRVVVVEMEEKSIGLVVDAVSEVLQVEGSCIEPPSPVISGVDTAYLAGIANLEDRLVIILDLSKVLSAGEKEELAAASLESEAV